MKDDAVSEVVGVMILLSITLVLAVIFASSAGSLVSDIDGPVNGELIFAGDTGDKFIFEMESGDGVVLSNLKVVYKIDGDNKAGSYYESFDMSSYNGVITPGERFEVPKPSFASDVTDDIVYVFYDLNSGMKVSSGEIQTSGLIDIPTPVDPEPITPPTPAPIPPEPPIPIIDEYYNGYIDGFKSYIFPMYIIVIFEYRQGYYDGYIDGFKNGYKGSVNGYDDGLSDGEKRGLSDSLNITNDIFYGSVSKDDYELGKIYGYNNGSYWAEHLDY